MKNVDFLFGWSSHPAHQVPFADIPHSRVLVEFFSLLENYTCSTLPVDSFDVHAVFGCTRRFDEFVYDDEFIDRIVEHDDICERYRVHALFRNYEFREDHVGRDRQWFGFETDEYVQNFPCKFITF